MLAAIAERFAGDERVVVLPEPVEVWRGIGLLESLYDGTVSALLFQIVALVTGKAPLVDALRRPGVRVVVTEGSPTSNHLVYACVNLQRRDLCTYRVVYDALRRVMPRCRGVTLLLDADVETAARRIRKRGRSEERHIPRPYMEALHDARERMIAAVDHPTFRLDASLSASRLAACVGDMVMRAATEGVLRAPQPLVPVAAPVSDCAERGPDRVARSNRRRVAADLVEAADARGHVPACAARPALIGGGDDAIDRHRYDAFGSSDDLDDVGDSCAMSTNPDESDADGRMTDDDGQLELGPHGLGGERLEELLRLAAQCLRDAVAEAGEAVVDLEWLFERCLRRLRRAGAPTGAAPADSPVDITSAITVWGAQLGHSMLHGVKRVENRSFRLRPGWYALHVGSKPGCHPGQRALLDAVDPPLPSEELLPRAAVIGAVHISHSLRLEECPDGERWASGPIVNVIDARCGLATPVAHAGSRSIWLLGESARDTIRAQLGQSVIRRNDVSHLAESADGRAGAERVGGQRFVDDCAHEGDVAMADGGAGGLAASAPRSRCSSQEAPAGLDEGGDDVAAEQVDESSWAPKTVAELLDAIKNRNYGVSANRSPALAAPAIRAHNAAAGSDEQVAQPRDLPLRDGFYIVQVRGTRTTPAGRAGWSRQTAKLDRSRVSWQAPAGLSRRLASDLHLVDGLARMRLVTSGYVAASVPFTYQRRRMSVLCGEAALSARRHVAAAMDSSSVAWLRRPMSPERPEWGLMQQLSDAGLGTCPVSGVPVFDPSRCRPELRRSIWRAYCAVACGVNDRRLGAMDEAFSELQRDMNEHVAQLREWAPGAARALVPSDSVASRRDRPDGSARAAPARRRRLQPYVRRSRRAIRDSSTDEGEGSDCTEAGRDSDRPSQQRGGGDGTDDERDGATDSDASSSAAAARALACLSGGDDAPMDGGGPAASTDGIDASLADLDASGDGEGALRTAISSPSVAALRGGGSEAIDELGATGGTPDGDLDARDGTGRNAVLLARLHPLPGDAHLTFEEASHSYTVWGAAVERSVTALVGALFGEFDPARCTAAMFERWARNPESVYYDVIQQVRSSGGTDAEAAVVIQQAWKALGAEAARLGTALHLYAELTLNREDADVPAELAKEVEQFQAFQCSAFVRDAGLAPYRTELSVAYRDGAQAVTAGQIDCLYRDRAGRLYLFDFKRVSSKHLLQPWERCYGRYGSAPVHEVPDSPFWRYSLQLSLYNVMAEQVRAAPRRPAARAQCERGPLRPSFV